MRRTRRNEFVPTERNLERWQAVRELLPDGLRARPGTVIGEIEDLAVLIVDGEVEGERNPPFWRGGHNLVYPSFIPRNTVWLDGNYDPKFLRFVLYHELVEHELMALGVPYSLEEKGGRGAHEFALDAEPETDPIRRNSGEQNTDATLAALRSEPLDYMRWAAAFSAAQRAGQYLRVFMTTGPKAVPDPYWERQGFESTIQEPHSWYVSRIWPPGRAPIKECSDWQIALIAVGRRGEILGSHAIFDADGDGIRRFDRLYGPLGFDYETVDVRRNSDEHSRRASRLALAEGSPEAITRALVEIARSGGADRVRMLAAFGCGPALRVFSDEVQVTLGDYVEGVRHVASLNIRDLTRWMLALVEQGAAAVAKTPTTDRLPRRTAAWARSVLERAAMEATTWLRAAVESGEGVLEVDYHRMGVDIDLFGDDTPENAETLEPAAMRLFYNACVTSAFDGLYAAESALTAAAWGRHIPGVTQASQVELLARVVLTSDG